MNQLSYYVTKRLIVGSKDSSGTIIHVSTNKFINTKYGYNILLIQIKNQNNQIWWMEWEWNSSQFDLGWLWASRLFFFHSHSSHLFHFLQCFNLLLSSCLSSPMNQTKREGWVPSLCWFWLSVLRSAEKKEKKSLFFFCFWVEQAKNWIYSIQRR